MTLGGSVAIVTGAGSALGRAIALALGAAGAACVAVVDDDVDAAADAAAAVRAAGTRAVSHGVDVADPVALALCFADIHHHEGVIGVVCNNTSATSGEPVWPASSLARLNNVVDVNLKSVVFGTRLAVEHMAGHGGVVINTASHAGLAPFEADPVYAATRAAIIHLTRSCGGIAASHGVRVNAVCPADGEGAPSPEIVASAVIDLVTDITRAAEVVVVGVMGAVGGEVAREAGPS